MIAYLSMEIGLQDSIPTFSGGLGALSGDHVRTASDMKMPLVAVTLLHKNGYFRQEIVDGRQVEHPENYNPAADPDMEKLPVHLPVKLGDCDVGLNVWRYKKSAAPAYLLDPTGNGNGQEVEEKVSWLYRGDSLLREALLGIGGARLLEELYGDSISTYHMNESQTAFLALALLKQFGSADKVRERSVFTTHSPVAGHANYDYERVGKVLGDLLPDYIKSLAGDDYLDMTRLAFGLSRFTNGVSKKHAETVRASGRDVAAITNGVYIPMWTSPEMQALFDADLPGWRENPAVLAGAGSIGAGRVEAAHKAAKRRMIDYVEDKTGVRFDEGRPVITFARRMAEYKRPWLLLSDMERLKKILMETGGQVIYSGKAHPDDVWMKGAIGYINQRLKELREAGINAAYVPNYKMGTCRLLSAGSDVWLNVPRIPQEASGTSGMCAADNGVAQGTTLDGWGPEGLEEGVTGWAIGGAASDDAADAESLYQKLPQMLVNPPDGRVVIAKNAPRFSSHRMMGEYARAYGLVE